MSAASDRSDGRANEQRAAGWDETNSRRYEFAYVASALGPIRRISRKALPPKWSAFFPLHDGCLFVSIVSDDDCTPYIPRIPCPSMGDLPEAAQLHDYTTAQRQTAGQRTSHAMPGCHARDDRSFFGASLVCLSRSTGWGLASWFDLPQGSPPGSPYGGSRRPRSQWPQFTSPCPAQSPDGTRTSEPTITVSQVPLTQSQIPFVGSQTIFSVVGMTIAKPWLARQSCRASGFHAEVVVIRTRALDAGRMGRSTGGRVYPPTGGGPSPSVSIRSIGVPRSRRSQWVVVACALTL
ncbi:uncharacterized protein N7482_004597 [Penicillium canariense]|uniref:Uncharacterized protein n=1 Tax=Penicillium canariense TaxID=189055 RepID=A0A9W9I904_9EURO|nr:uncharacterized protein N7482_004597 [Penicillium canariense]KAJ5169003.1 hypothetical protein N7482_004597 [Penicillium canariense]